MLEGIVPDNEEQSSDRLNSDDNSEIDEGILPLRQLELIDIVCKLTRSPMSYGIAPVNGTFKRRLVSEVKRDIDDGIVPSIP